MEPKNTVHLEFEFEDEGLEIRAKLNGVSFVLNEKQRAQVIEIGEHIGGASFRSINADVRCPKHGGLAVEARQSGRCTECVVECPFRWVKPV